MVHFIDGVSSNGRIWSTLIKGLTVNKQAGEVPPGKGRFGGI